jgi:hypothetical protein
MSALSLCCYSKAPQDPKAVGGFILSRALVSAGIRGFVVFWERFVVFE